MQKFVTTLQRLVLLGSCGVGLVWTATAAAEPEPQALTLENAITLTLERNPQLHQFGLQRQQLLEQRQVSDRASTYQLGIEVENIAGSEEAAGIGSSEVTVALSSVLELGGKRRSRVTVADARLYQFELEQQVATLDMLGELTRLFITTLAMQEQLKLAIEAETLAQTFLTTVSERAARGADSDIDVLRARAALTQANINRGSRQAELERYQSTLATYWGDRQTDYAKVAGDLFRFGQSQDMTLLFERVQQSPAFAVLASEKRLKQAELQLAKAQSHADVDWQLGVKHNSDSSENSLSLGFSVPLFTGQRNRSEVNLARLASNAVDIERRQTELVLYNQLFSAFSQRQQSIRVDQQLQQRVIPDLQKVLQITRAAYERGRLSYQDLIAAQHALLTAKQQRIDTALTVLLNQTIIEQLIAEPLTH